MRQFKLPNVAVWPPVEGTLLVPKEFGRDQGL